MNKTATVSEMIATVDAQINVLDKLKVAIQLCFPGAYVPTPNKAPVLKRHSRKPRKSGVPVGQRGTLKPLVLAVIQDASGPLKVKGVLEVMLARGWQTTSVNPKSLVGVTLATLAKSGAILKAKEGYTAVTVAQAEPRTGTVLDTEAVRQNTTVAA